ncbi:hypothetical protein [Phenylobacterium sp.]|uniref:hypothetical protein n=1 Tax=Phenylobacterium sp. TaxID=1871053 RepID=UPI0027379462|nr:hypothetical protein [Phenylobacterium sp.]MDP3869130.1 hypothetical protein [Phenylobacterium sp.]
MTLTLEQRQRESAARREIQAVRKEAKANAPVKVKQARAFPVAEGQRQVRERDPGYLAFVRRCGCVVGAITGEPCSGPIDAMHQRFSDPKAGRVNPGMGRKSDDRWALGGCRHHHTMQHGMNERKFWAEYVQTDPTDLAREMFAAYLAGEDGAAVLRRFTPTVTP